MQARQSLHAGFLPSRTPTVSPAAKLDLASVLYSGSNVIMDGVCVHLPVDERRSPAGFADKVLEEWILEVSLCCSRHFAHHTAVIGSLDLKNEETSQTPHLELCLLAILGYGWTWENYLLFTENYLQ